MLPFFIKRFKDNSGIYWYFVIYFSNKLKNEVENVN